MRFVRFWILNMHILIIVGAEQNRADGVLFTFETMKTLLSTTLLCCSLLLSGQNIMIGLNGSYAPDAKAPNSNFSTGIFGTTQESQFELNYFPFMIQFRVIEGLDLQFTSRFVDERSEIGIEFAPLVYPMSFFKEMKPFVGPFIGPSFIAHETNKFAVGGRLGYGFPVMRSRFWFGVGYDWYEWNRFGREENFRQFTLRFGWGITIGGSSDEREEPESSEVGLSW